MVTSSRTSGWTMLDDKAAGRYRGGKRRQKQKSSRIRSLRCCSSRLSAKHSFKNERRDSESSEFCKLAWRTDSDTGEHYKIDSGADSGLDASIDAIVHQMPQPKSGICSVCGSGATTIPFRGMEVCESCFMSAVKDLSPEEFDALIQTLQVDPSELQSSQPSSVQPSAARPQNSEAGKCSHCGYVFPTGPGSSGSHRKHYEQAHPDMLV